MTKQKIFILFIINLYFSSLLVGQEESQRKVFLEVDIEYFIIEPFISDFHNEFDFDPTEIIKEKYSKCKMFCLNGLKKYAWPVGAKNNPHLILYIEAALLDEGECSGAPELSIKEKDFNGNKLSSTCFQPTIKCKRNKVKCVNSAIKRFKERFEKQPFPLEYSNSRIIYPQSGPLYIKSDTVSVIKTEHNWNSVELLLADKDSSTIEGIYSSLDTTGAIYTFGLYKSDSIHRIVILESNVAGWEEGDLKGTLENDRDSEDFIVKWITANKTYVFPKAVFSNNGLLELRFDEPGLKRTKVFKKLE